MSFPIDVIASFTLSISIRSILVHGSCASRSLVVHQSLTARFTAHFTNLYTCKYLVYCRSCPKRFYPFTVDRLIVFSARSLHYQVLQLFIFCSHSPTSPPPLLYQPEVHHSLTAGSPVDGQPLSQAVPDTDSTCDVDRRKRREEPP